MTATALGHELFSKISRQLEPGKNHELTSSTGRSGSRILLKVETPRNPWSKDFEQLSEPGSTAFEVLNSSNYP